MTDFAVIGGGVVGGAIAYGLARRGKRVVLLDEGDNALRASRGNGGLVWVQNKGLDMPDYTRLSLHSAQMWPEFAANLLQDTGIDVGYEQRGGIQCCLSETERDASADEVDLMMANCGADGLDLRMIDRDEVLKLAPGIGDKVIAASHCTQDGAASPLRMLRALHAGVEAYGSSISTGPSVSAIEPEGSRYALRRGDTTINAERVVIAAGLGSRALAASVGIDLPIRPQKGQGIVTDRVPGRQQVFVSKARQTHDGHFILGSSVEEDAPDLSTDFEFFGKSIARSLQILPALEHAKLLRVWAAYRIITPDSYPIYAESNVCPGVHVAVCHSGITLGAFHAIGVPAQLTGEAAGNPMTPFSLNRFKDAA